MLDLKIVGGEIVDGTGKPRFRGDVGVRDGRIVAIGSVTEKARETIDATGRIVSPGFVDVHTHYDAQAFWEPTLSPSCYHGVTTIFGGFCGFSIAPITPESAEYLRPMLARVEGMPLEALENAVPWNWQSFGEYLGRIDGKIGLNAGFFAGHCAIRRLVMGKRAVGEKATPEDLKAMKALLGKSLAEGALGFSSSLAPSHRDGDGNPVPSRWADDSELIELARVVRDYEGTGLAFLPKLGAPGTVELMAEFSIAGNRPVDWNQLAVIAQPAAEKTAAAQLEMSDYARERGGEVIALTQADLPMMYVNLRDGVTFDHAIPGIWRDMFKWPVEERIQRFREPEFRKRLAQDAASVAPGSPMADFAKFDGFTIVSVDAEANKTYVGRKAGDIATEQGRTSLEVMLDIAIEDQLNTLFSFDFGGHDAATFALRGRVWADDRVLIGASDAGAHLDHLDCAAYSTTFLQKGVREHKVISLEQAVHLITQRPAEYHGLIDRGVIALGNHADIVVFDSEAVGRATPYRRYDIPGGGRAFRVYAEAEGIDHVFVNGVAIVHNNKHTGQMPGTVLRSGRDTKTVPIDVMRKKKVGAVS